MTATAAPDFVELHRRRNGQFGERLRHETPFHAPPPPLPSAQLVSEPPIPAAAPLPSQAAGERMIVARRRLDQAIAEVTRQERAIAAAAAAGGGRVEMEKLQESMRDRLDAMTMAADRVRVAEADFVRLVRAEGEQAIQDSHRTTTDGSSK